MRRAYSHFIIGLFSTAALAADDANVPTYIHGEARTVISNWLAKNPNLRIAVDEDCSCQERIQAIRTGTYGAGKPIPNYHPYYMAGDFNNDESPDIAVIALEEANPANSTFVIFNGPFNDLTSASPAFMSRKLSGALFYGPPRPEPFRLVIGSFNSEGVVLEPTAETYEPVEDEQ